MFGYGSLTQQANARAATLVGWARGWGVAMDNTVTIPGYKYYLDPDGRRPDVCVAFLDISPQPGSQVVGTCFPVDPVLRAELDERERNYRRIDVTDHVLEPHTGSPADGRIWAYTGLIAARQRASDARTIGRLVVARAYLDTVPPRTIAPDVAVVDLIRVDVNRPG